MKLAHLIFFPLVLAVTLFAQFVITNHPNQADASASQTLPNGYFAFPKAPPNARPPKIRKPPYLPITAECQGIYDTNTLSAKNTLCGDINRGYIPRNPMGQYLLGQPYPFELIKNKTLQFLSKSLPYLKDEIDSIPKVARFVKPSEFFKSHLRRHRRQVANYSEASTAELANLTNPETVLSPVLPSVESKENNNNNSTKLSRQNLCEGNAVCQTLESLKEEGPFSKSFLANVVSAMGNMASVNNIVTLLDQYNQLNQDTASPLHNSSNHNGNKFGLSQILSTVSSINSNLGGGSSSGTNGGPTYSNAYSPLLSIIDYIQSLQTPKYASKRKTPSDIEDLIPEGPEKPQTPCTSSEEYISPTYARNYQGVWKYVVQIPNEGYFTQTIQQTSCVKQKCDLIEGSCKESPRWVSLLVAEIFYPDMYFPVNQIMPLLYKQQMQQTQSQMPQQQQQQQQQQQPQMLQQQHPLHSGQSDLNSASQYQVINSNHNQIKRAHHPTMIQPSHHKNFDLAALANMIKRGDHAAYDHPALHNVELLARRARTAIDKSTTSAGNDNNSENNDGSEKKHCDGYDKIGCYVVRVYYDWFLINGSCKCWKTGSSGGGLNINETIKRIFIGKWKKK